MDDKLELLLADGVIDEVLGRLKSGKEANISLVRRGDDVIAAKVYKDRSTRSFKNNADYKEGRKVRNTRTQRAMDSGGKFGRDAAEQEWKSAEADALYRLVGSGVRVPAPVLFYEGVLLMELVRGPDGGPAARMIDVTLDPSAALGVYADLCAQVIAMLCCDLIHGDLSPYNILAGADGPTIIDFPQVVSAVHSSRAEFYFLRDFDNIVRFVAGFDPALAVHTADGRAIWRAYVSRELTPQFVPPPPPPPRPTRGPDRRGRPDDRGRDRRGRPDDRGRPPRGNGPQRTDSAPHDRSPHGNSSPREGSPHGAGPTQRNGSSQRNGGPQPSSPTQPRAGTQQPRLGEPAPRRNDRPPLGADGRPLPPSSVQPQAPRAYPRGPQMPRAERPPPRAEAPRPGGGGKRRRPKRHW